MSLLGDSSFRFVDLHSTGSEIPDPSLEPLMKETPDPRDTPSGANRGTRWRIDNLSRIVIMAVTCSKRLLEHNETNPFYQAKKK